MKLRLLTIAIITASMFISCKKEKKNTHEDPIIEIINGNKWKPIITNEALLSSSKFYYQPQDCELDNIYGFDFYYESPRLSISKNQGIKQCETPTSFESIFKEKQVVFNTGGDKNQLVLTMDEDPYKKYTISYENSILTLTYSNTNPASYSVDVHYQFVKID